jgi:D-glycero-D-manno-heptose 1,7-bisphosphate phosphatase
MREHDDIGLWAERLTGKSFVGRPALFLDRDGVVVEEVHFLKAPCDMRLTSGIATAIASANARDIAVVLITNQSGIARGQLEWADFARVQKHLIATLTAAGAYIDLVLACGYHPDGIGNLARDHEWRKPRPGMLLEAENRLGVDLVQSCVIGDRVSDLEAGLAAGLRQGAMVRDGYGTDHWQRHADQIEHWSNQARMAIIDTSNGASAITSWLSSKPVGLDR